MMKDTGQGSDINWIAKKNNGSAPPGSYYFQDPREHYYVNNPTINTDTWYHICWVVGADGTGAFAGKHEEYLYLDGVRQTIAGNYFSAPLDNLYATGSGDVWWHAGDKPDPVTENFGIRKLGLQGNSSSDDNYNIYSGYASNHADYVGMMDEFSIWDEPLGPKQVAYIYNSGSARDLSDGIPAEFEL